MRTLNYEGLAERARYDKGRQRVERILTAAQEILIDEGYDALSMRRIAAAAGLTVGNVSYYFPSKEELIHDLINAVLDSYYTELERIRSKGHSNPDQGFREAAHFLLDDLKTRETTKFFPELWVLANRDPFVARCVEAMYGKEREVIADLIRQLNPALTPEKALTLALLVASSVEGLTIFIGHDKPWNDRADGVIATAIDSYVAMVKAAN